MINGLNEEHKNESRLSYSVAGFIYGTTLMKTNSRGGLISHWMQHQRRQKKVKDVAENVVREGDGCSGGGHREGGI